MKKIYCLFIVMLFLSSVFSTVSYAAIVLLPVSPTNICDEMTTTYEIRTTGVFDCLYDYHSITVSNGAGTVKNIINSTNQTWIKFDVEWNNNLQSAFMATITANVYGRIGLFGGSCNNPITRTLDVTVHPKDPTSISPPSSITVQQISSTVVQFSTSSSNAHYYQWVVTGGTIQGSATGATIRVNRTSCTVTAKVRGRHNTACNGTIYSTFTPVRTYQYVAPHVSRLIGGEAYLAPNTIYNYSINLVAGDQYNWSLSDPGGRLTLLGNGSRTVAVNMGSPSPTVRDATLTCVVNPTCSTSVTLSRIIRYGGGMPPTAMREGASFEAYPNPSNSNDEITLRAQVFDDGKNGDIVFDRFVLYNTTGQIVEERCLEGKLTKDFRITGLSKGIYFVHIFNQNEMIEFKKLIVQ